VDSFAPGWSGVVFWIVVSIVLSVGLTILLNLGLLAFGGYTHEQNILR
jgi:hypothetical protein